MEDCKFCGQPAGFLRRQHADCAAHHDHGWAEMIRLAREAASGNATLDTLEARLSEIARSSFIPVSEVKKACVQAWEAVVEHFLDDGNLDAEEERHLVAFQDRLGLGQAELDSHGAFSKMVKGATLRDLMNGNLPQRVRVQGDLPFNFQKNEHLMWVFTGVDYLEDKMRTEYVGRSSGVSIRIAKGLYYRVGAFRGHPITKTERVHIDTGSLAVTNKHIYFAGPRKSLRVRHDKIVSFIPFSDGVGIVRDAATAKPQVFITGDGWFTYNLLANVSQL